MSLEATNPEEVVVFQLADSLKEDFVLGEFD